MLSKKIIKALEESDLEGSIHVQGELSGNRYYILSLEIGYYGEDPEDRDPDIGPSEGPPTLQEAEEIPSLELDKIHEN